MSEFPQIFAFYSFKGGVGRSMALLNVAYALAAKGRHVLVLDMDLEAPGVSGFLHREGEIPGFARFDMVDLVGWAKSVPLPLASDSFPPLSDYAVSIPRDRLESIPRVFSELGHLDIIPVDEERDYYSRLTTLALNNSDQHDLVRIGSVLRAWIKSLRVPVEVPDYYGPDYDRSAPYDYVLVDSRTGITETGGLCIGPLSDQLVVLTALNNQNVKGTRNFLTEVGVLQIPDHSGSAADSRPDAPDPSMRPKPYLIVASLVPSGEIEKKQERLRCAKEELGKVDLKLSYHPQLALKESIFTRDYREEHLAGEYDQLLNKVLHMASDGVTSEPPQALLKSTRSLEEFQESINEMLRSAPISEAGSGFFLRFLLSTLNVSEVTQSTEFFMWDRVCRTLSSGDSPSKLDVANSWANILAQWSLHSVNPELSSLRFQAALHRYEQVLQDTKASQAQKASALFNRGLSYGKRGEAEWAIEDYNALVAMPDAPAEHKAKALINRGVAHGKRGERERAIEDYTALVAMPNVSAEQKANALINRGIEYGKRGETERAIEDCTAVVAMPDAPADSKAQALVGRGWTYYLAGRYLEAIADEQNAIAIQPEDSTAHGNLAIALLVMGRVSEALVAYSDALALADFETLDEMSEDLRGAMKEHGSISCAEEIFARIEARRRALSEQPMSSDKSPVLGGKRAGKE